MAKLTEIFDVTENLQLWAIADDVVQGPYAARVAIQTFDESGPVGEVHVAAVLIRHLVQALTDAACWLADRVGEGQS